MTISEKLIYLRNTHEMSQEKLSNLLNVSRQAISKWESGESLPQLDKIKDICRIFNLSFNELMDDKIIIHQNQLPKIKLEKDIKTKYFGTDGFRGEANVNLTSDHAYKIGRFLGWFYSNPKYNNLPYPNYRAKIVIGKDTRRSSYMLEYAVACGIASSGGDVCLMHVTTTPSVSYITKEDNFDCGVMITASHNPFYDNGIKIINCKGEKLEDEVAYLIEAYIDGKLDILGIKENDLPFAKKENIGSITDYSSGRNRYIAYLISLAKHSFKNYRVGLDVANGASYMIAQSVFSSLGAKVYMLNNDPNGLNINVDAGNTHIEKLEKFVKENKLDVGFAFDGDADRCIAVDENGNEVDGDKILYLLAKQLKDEGALTNNTLAITIMSNSGLIKALKKLDINTVQTKVGDRFVYEKMINDDYSLGGEKSGHIIIRKFATTGDGILTALSIMEAMISSHQKLSELVKPVKLLPQVLKNVRVIDKSLIKADEEIMDAFHAVNNALKDNGRILLRESGTEPVIRIMVEAKNIDECNKYIDKIYNLIKKRGYVCE